MAKGNTIILKKKSPNFVSMMKIYWINLRLIFSNCYGILTMLNFILKSPYHKIKVIYTNVYFQSFMSSSEYISILYQQQLGSSVAVPVFVVLQFLFIDFLSKRTKIAIGIVLLIKNVTDLITSWMIFDQKNPVITSVGIWFEFALTKGLNALIIVMMQTVVDERASSFCVVLINMLE